MKKNVWLARESLDQYFPETKVSSDEIAILKFLLKFIQNQEKKIDRMIDFGAGPVIHRMLPFVPYVSKIYLAEYLDESLGELKKWVKNSKNSRNWDTYIATELKLENKRVTKFSISNRRSMLREKIKKILKGDIFKPFPLNVNTKFPLVTSFYCLDAVTSSKKIWEKLMSNLSTLVKPGGWLIISASRNTSYSLLGDTKMPNVNLNENDIHDTLIQLGYIENSIDIKIIPAKLWESVGISSVLIAKAQKNHEFKS